MKFREVDVANGTDCVGGADYDLVLVSENNDVS